MFYFGPNIAHQNTPGFPGLFRLVGARVLIACYFVNKWRAQGQLLAQVEPRIRMHETGPQPSHV